jgi:hypothetical protein
MKKLIAEENKNIFSKIHYIIKNLFKNNIINKKLEIENTTGAE